MAPATERRRAAPAPPPPPADPIRIMEALRRRVYLVSTLLGVAVLLILGGLEMFKAAPTPALLAVYAGLLLMCGWALVWLLRGGSVQWGERVVIACNVVVVLTQFVLGARESGPAQLLLTASNFGFLLTVSMLGYLALPLRAAAALSFGTTALGLVLTVALGGLARGGLDLLRVHLSALPLLLLLYALAWYRERFTQEYTRRLLLETQAHTDPLTGLPNRRALYGRIEAALATAEPCSVVLLDIDHFKRVNDRYGHQTGDDVLVWVARRLRGGLRGGDVLGRWGGEEFLLLLPGTGPEDAWAVAERLRAELHATPHPEAGEVTVSLGVAGAQPGDNLARLTVRADTALYQAKHQGRNRAVLLALARPDEGGATLPG
ncbi:sensor domain-containing diguanylate cyclase [Deinococcus petrolearius]|uniref:Diguanylate cyclase n=1 Tax=Deinococcus petrolearius TaxID=1751295 RepID=A0ABW1DGT5_9DEIO